jgi:C_GCAxxG_C_C family probable redox protein
MMNDHMERARQLRTDLDRHYNCCQSVLVPFAEEMGLSKEQACALGSHFGSGMRHGSACGALSGALMVLGALGYDESHALELLRQFRAEHEAADCRTLLKLSHDRGEERKAHCDGLVYEMVEALDQILAAQ